MGQHYRKKYRDILLHISHKFCTFATFFANSASHSIQTGDNASGTSKYGKTNSNTTQYQKKNNKAT